MTLLENLKKEFYRSIQVEARDILRESPAPDAVLQLRSGDIDLWLVPHVSINGKQVYFNKHGRIYVYVSTTTYYGGTYHTMKGWFKCGLSEGQIDPKLHTLRVILAHLQKVRV